MNLHQQPTLRRMIGALRWTKSSTALLGLFLVTIVLIVYIWWPLAEMVIGQVDWRGPWWQSMDWLLVGIFAFMSLLIVAGADVKRDALILLVGACGGLVIESWGTQTRIWTYFTNERPPLWIIPAWPIASLAIDRMVRMACVLVPEHSEWSFRRLYWIVFAAFYGLMLAFVWPSIDRPMTLAALALCTALILLPDDKRLTLLQFGAGAGLGYFLEVWGTTRECWTYYTHETPPLFAVLAHGMAAVAFWRAGLLISVFYISLMRRASALLRPANSSTDIPSSS